MTSRTFHILQNAIYLLVIVVLCGMIHRPYNVQDSFFKEYYIGEEKAVTGDVKDKIAYIKWHMHEPYQYERVSPYYYQMLYVDSITKDVISYLDSKETKATTSDSLRKRIEDYITTLLGQIKYDSAALRPIVDRFIVGDFTLQDKPNWVDNIFKNQPAEKRPLLFSILRSNVYHVEAMVIKRLMELGRIVDVVAVTVKLRWYFLQIISSMLAIKQMLTSFCPH